MIRRRIVSINNYKRFFDGWSKDIVVGLVIRDGLIKDARMGDLYEDGVFYDMDGQGFRATHVVVLQKGDVRIGRKISVKPPFVPTEEQIKTLAIVARRTQNKELKGLLKGIRTL